MFLLRGLYMFVNIPYPVSMHILFRIHTCPSPAALTCSFSGILRHPYITRFQRSYMYMPLLQCSYIFLVWHSYLFRLDIHTCLLRRSYISVSVVYTYPFSGIHTFSFFAVQTYSFSGVHTNLVSGVRSYPFLSAFVYIPYPTFIYVWSQAL